MLQSRLETREFIGHLFPRSGYRLQVAFQYACFLAQIAQLLLEDSPLGPVAAGSVRCGRPRSIQLFLQLGDRSPFPIDFHQRARFRSAEAFVGHLCIGPKLVQFGCKLARFSDTPTTFDNYRKEAERLLLWSTMAMGKPVSSLTHEDLLAYQLFLADPQPMHRWVMPRGRKVACSHPDWRPFAGPLAPSSQRQAIVILNTMFSWLVNAGYLAGNPLSLSRQRARRAKPRVTRYLEPNLWAEVKQTIDQMPKETDREREHYFRLRWLFSLLYLCGLRISEVVGNSMAGFFCRRDKDGEERWWLEITGKGDKTRIVPATND